MNYYVDDQYSPIERSDTTEVIKAMMAALWKECCLEKGDKVIKSINVEDLEKEKE